MFDTGHIHPMIVHFPIALIFVGFIADLLSLFFNKREACLSKTGFYLMILGTLGAIAGYLSGEFFTSEMTGEAGEPRERHELFAKITMFIMIAASVLRIIALILKKERSVLKWIVFTLYFLALIAVGYTGMLGGTLVYNFMIGI